MKNSNEGFFSSKNPHQLEYVSSGHKPVNSHKWGPGVRDVYALHYIIKGKGTLKTRSKEFELKEGESFLIYPYTEISYHPDSTDPWEYAWIEFKGEEASRIIDLTRFSVDSPVSPAASINLAEYYFTELDADKTAYEDIRLEAKLRLLLSYYVEQFPADTLKSDIDYVQQAKKYIYQHYWKASLTVSDIVEAVNIERSYLFRLFKGETGLSISSYIRQVRIQQACVLLESSDLSVSSIAYSVGYKDPLYFSKVFKKTMAKSPSTYRL